MTTSLFWFFKRRAAPQAGGDPGLREATIEWRTDAGEKIQQPALLQSNGISALRALVKRAPSGSIAQLRERGSSYPLTVVSVHESEEGFELALDYVLEGRRRERRVRTQGPSLLLAEGIGAVQVEVLNVSSGGMQLCSTGAVHEGSAARIYGSDANRICFVRYCKSAKGDYLIGIQFCGLDQEKAPSPKSGS